MQPATVQASEIRVFCQRLRLPKRKAPVLTKAPVTVGQNHASLILKMLAVLRRMG